jgi:GNAT superfamily N-acetyltransferase
LGKVVPLLSASNLEFDCGDSQLNRWFKKRAIENEAAGFSRTYVMQVQERSVGYYSLSAAAIDIDPAALDEPSAPDPIPAILLGRMAVGLEYQGIGVGKRLLSDAIARARFVATKVGAAVLLVHPKPAAREYYLANGFAPLSSNDAVFLKL